MRETTAEIWIGPDQSNGWIGTQGGINATHLLLLRENSRPAWLLLPGNLYDTRPPKFGPAIAWVPTPRNPVQDALLQFSVMGARVPEIRDLFDQFDKSRSKARIDLADKFPEGVPAELYLSMKQHLVGWHVVVSVGSGSLANEDLDQLTEYQGLNLDIRTSKR